MAYFAISLWWGFFDIRTGMPETRFGNSETNFERCFLVEMQIEFIDQRGGLFHRVVDNVLHLLRSG